MVWMPTIIEVSLHHSPWPYLSKRNLVRLSWLWIYILTDSFLFLFFLKKTVCSAVSWRRGISEASILNIQYSCLYFLSVLLNQPTHSPQSCISTQKHLWHLTSPSSPAPTPASPEVHPWDGPLALCERSLGFLVQYPSGCVLLKVEQTPPVAGLQPL